MKGKIVLLVVAMVLSLGLVGTPATWANSLTFQDVTFNMTVNASGNLNLNIVNALNASGDWTGIDYLKAFQINNYGTASGLSVTGWSTEPGGLSAGGAGGCNLSGSGTCFSYPGSGFALTNNFTLEIVKTTGAFNLNLFDAESGKYGPHLKVFFAGANQGDGHGNLLSQTVPAPEPSSLMLLGAAFAAVGVWRRKALQL